MFEVYGSARVLASAGVWALRVVWGVLWWAVRHYRFSLVCVLVAMAGWVCSSGRTVVLAVAAVVVPALVSVVWLSWWPGGFERLVAGPWRRYLWRRWVRRSWTHLARECGLSGTVIARDGSTVWVAPGLMDVVSEGHTLTVRVRTRVGQTVEDLEVAVPAIGTAAGAVSWRSVSRSPSALDIVLVMADALTVPTRAEVPVEVVVDAVTLGRRQDGSAWVLPVRGRHTLVVGATGSGKGSVLWGIAGGLAPAVHGGLVELWGLDLKRGVEIEMGRALFAHTAYTVDEALNVLRSLLAVIDARGSAMAGVSRLHEPVSGDPMHVLVIDELAAMTAYADSKTKMEANRLLAEVLTQGRALGVVVVACVQDPRKETVGARGLFSQTVALRLKDASETRMVLGDGMAAAAPAHRIVQGVPGTAWVVTDDGHADRVRAAYWPDTLVQDVATTYAPVDGPSLIKTNHDDIDDDLEGVA